MSRSAACEGCDLQAEVESYYVHLLKYFSTILRYFTFLPLNTSISLHHTFILQYVYQTLVYRFRLLLRKYNQLIHEVLLQVKVPAGYEVIYKIYIK